ncbi:MAG: hypothetical protein EBR40_03065 [Proteobacteria bacterium]|nr:hypothetical protein [Pseudomonadota bacterium]
MVTYYFGALNPFTGIILDVLDPPPTHTRDYFPVFTIKLMEIGEAAGRMLAFDIHEDDRLDIISSYGDS